MSCNKTVISEIYSDEFTSAMIQSKRTEPLRGYFPGPMSVILTSKESVLPANG
jgi:hypothetical protein